MVRTLSEEEKDFMCRYVQEGIVLGEGPEKLTQRREWLHNRLDTRSPVVVRGVTAHLYYRARELFPGHWEDADTTAKQLRERLIGVSGDDRIAAQTDMAEETGTTLDVIQGITNGVLADMAFGGAGATGEHANYNNPIKILWRRKLQECIRQFFERYNVTPQQIAKMKVLCLPGKLCLEVPMYVELGFDPKNIVGVEGGDRLARAEFEWNAEKMGIDWRVGKLEKVLPKDENKYDVVSMDWHGYASNSNMLDLQEIGLAERSIVMINRWTQREHRTVLKQYELLHGTIRPAVARDIAAYRQMKIATLDRVLQRKDGVAMPTDPAPLKGDFDLPAIRDQYPFGIPLVGLRNRRHWITPEAIDSIPVIPLYSNVEMPEACRQRSGDYLYRRDTIGEQVGRFPAEIDSVLSQIGLTFRFSAEDRARKLWFRKSVMECAFGASKVVDLHKLAYDSPQSHQHTSFYTDIATLERPAKEYQRFIVTINALLEAARLRVEGVDRADREGADDVFTWNVALLENSKRLKKKKGGVERAVENAVGKNDKQFYIDGRFFLVHMCNNKPVGTPIRLRSFMKFWEWIDEFQGRYPLGEDETLMQVEREKIAA